LFERFYKDAAPTVLTEIRKTREMEKKEKRRKLVILMTRLLKNNDFQLAN
jgi:hypothetical protein